MTGERPQRSLLPALSPETSARVLAAVMTGAGVLHFAVPATYEPIVPRALGHARALVLLSGAAEIACGALLAGRRTRRIGGWLTAGLLVGVLPANVQMALDAGPPLSGVGPALVWLRLPLQIPLVAWALRHARPR